MINVILNRAAKVIFFFETANVRTLKKKCYFCTLNF
jgi:hypothetical protein